jgi:enamine deaminase RidA (YjgF/YER057c/UK114 family)
MSIEAKIESLGLKIPQTHAPLYSYVPYVVTGNQVWISGQIARREGETYVYSFKLFLQTIYKIDLRLI